MPLGAFKAALMGTAGVSTASVVLLSTQTASGDASIEFTSGINSTYGEYIFKLYTINPDADYKFFFQFNADGESGYNESMTTTSWSSYQRQNGVDPGVSYYTGQDQANGTSDQYWSMGIGGGADECAAGELHLFNPSSTTYATQFTSLSQGYVPHSSSDYTIASYNSGYINTTAAITNVKFYVESGNFDGKIKMWGVK